MPRIKSGRYQAHYTEHRRRRCWWPSLPLPNYRQQDNHSCGFLAALTVARYFDSTVCHKAVLEAIRPSLNYGTDNTKMLRGLAALGIGTRYREDMDASRVHGVLAMGLPIIVSVWPDGWSGDHWTVVQGFSTSLDKVYLTNHYTMSVSDFEYEWIEAWGEETGAGIICTRR